MATLVTGGTGFIGSNNVRDLAQRGHQVVSFDIVPPDDLARRDVEPWADKVTWVMGDTLDKEALEEVASSHGIDKIIHNATYTHYGDLETVDGRRVFDINMMGTANALDLARQLGVKRFVYVSSAGVYYGADPSDQPLNEDIPFNPQSIYGITKYASERLTQRYGEMYGLDTVSVRLAQNWGPMERVTPYRTRMALPYVWAGMAVRGEPIEAEPFGKGITEGRRFNVEHPYVRDTAAAMSMVLEAPTLKYPVYNIATGHPVSLHEMVSAIREAHPGVKFVEPIPQEDASIASRRVLDVSRIREDVGFVPQYDLVSALRDYIKWRQTFNFMD